MVFTRSLTAGAALAGAALAYYVRERHQRNGEGYLHVINNSLQTPRLGQRETRQRATQAIEDGRSGGAPPRRRTHPAARGGQPRVGRARLKDTMTDRINLEFPASPRALSTVRMVLGGLGARVDFSIDDLEDLYLATSELLIAAMRSERLERLNVQVELDGDGLQAQRRTVPVAGPAARRQVDLPGGGLPGPVRAAAQHHGRDQHRPGRHGVPGGVRQAPGGGALNGHVAALRARNVEAPLADTSVPLVYAGRERVMSGREERHVNDPLDLEALPGQRRLGEDEEELDEELAEESTAARRTRRAAAATSRRSSTSTCCAATTCTATAGRATSSSPCTCRWCARWRAATRRAASTSTTSCRSAPSASSRPSTASTSARRRAHHLRHAQHRRRDQALLPRQGLVGARAARPAGAQHPPEQGDRRARAQAAALADHQRDRRGRRRHARRGARGARDEPGLQLGLAAGLAQRRVGRRGRPA